MQSVCNIRRACGRNTKWRSCIITSSRTALNINEIDRRGGYPSTDPRTFLERARDAWRNMPKVLNSLKESALDAVSMNKVVTMGEKSQRLLGHHDHWYLANFGSMPESEFKDWVVSSDSVFGEGYSTARFSRSNPRYATFSGRLSTLVNKNHQGDVERAGWTIVRSPLRYRITGSPQFHRLAMFNHIVLRVRGDGRKYRVTLHPHELFDMNWFDVYQYTLFTRGGPYWQTAKIPFSKFILSYKGRIQDRQEAISVLNSIKFVSISLHDQIDGPYRLDVESISFMHDDAHREEFAYEQYQPDGVRW